MARGYTTEEMDAMGATPYDPAESDAKDFGTPLSAPPAGSVPYDAVQATLDILKMDRSFASRYVNDGFSGGEKKRLEILQMAVLKPEVAILDETDSGLDIDALKVVSRGINAATGGDQAVLLVTHYQRILNYVKPDFVHVMIDGKIALSGGPDLALQLEERGYDWMKEDKEAKIEA